VRNTKIARRIPSKTTRVFEIFETAKKMERAGADIIHLEVGKTSFDTPSHIKEATKDALDQGYVHYDDFLGLLEFREVLAEKLKMHNRIIVDPKCEILVTAGITQGAFAAVMAVIDEGDEAVVFHPGYTNHDAKVRFAGGRPVPVALSERNGYTLDPIAIKKRITPKTRMIILVNPSNPLGRVFSYRELSMLASIAIENDLLVVADEVYECFTYDGRKHHSIAALPEMKNRTISLFAFTKAYAMEGWRLGYVAASKELIEHLKKVTMLSTTHSNVFIQKGAIEAVRGSQACVEEMVKENERRRNLVVERLNQMQGINCDRPEGAIYVFPDISGIGRPSERIAEYLLSNAHVATIPGNEYGEGGETHLRICFSAVPHDRLELALDRIEDALMQLK
jgi:aspartate aminotransferase